MSVRIDENTDHMKYTDDMEAIDSDIMDRVIAEMNSYDADIYTAKDVKEALAAETCSVDNFKALLSPAALPFLEEIAQKAQKETRKHFGNSVAILLRYILQTTAKIIVFTVDLIATTRSNVHSLMQKRLKKKCRRSQRQDWKKF